VIRYNPETGKVRYKTLYGYASTDPISIEYAKAIPAPSIVMGIDLKDDKAQPVRFCLNPSTPSTASTPDKKTSKTNKASQNPITPDANAYSISWDNVRVIAALQQEFKKSEEYS